MYISRKNINEILTHLSDPVNRVNNVKKAPILAPLLENNWKNAS